MDNPDVARCRDFFCVFSNSDLRFRENLTQSSQIQYRSNDKKIESCASMSSEDILYNQLFRKSFNFLEVKSFQIPKSPAITMKKVPSTKSSGANCQCNILKSELITKRITPKIISAKMCFTFIIFKFYLKPETKQKSPHPHPATDRYAI